MTIGDVLNDVACDLEICETAEDVDAALARALDRVADSLLDDFEQSLDTVPDVVADHLRREHQTRVMLWRRQAMQRIRDAIQAFTVPPVVH